jgi:hypothetical protein
MDPAFEGRWNLQTQPRSRRNAMQIIRVGLDLAKYVFEVRGVDGRGAVPRAWLESHSGR